MIDTNLLTVFCAALGWICAGAAGVWIVALLREISHLRGMMPMRDRRGRYASLRDLRQ